MNRPLLMAAMSMCLAAVAATPSAAAERETLLTRALSCRIDDNEIKTLRAGLAAEDPGMTSASQFMAGPSGNLHQLARPVSALGYSTSTVYLSPGRILMVVSGQSLASVSERLQLSPVPYSPAERRIDGARKILAYQLHQSAVAGKVLVGCEYANPAALSWISQGEEEL